MNRNYSRIKQAARYQQALTNYIAFIDGRANRQPNIGNGPVRDPSQVLYLSPFAVTVGATDLVQVSASKTAWGSYEAPFANFTKATLPSSTTALKLKGFRAARVVIISGYSTTNKEVKTSHITQSKYLKYVGAKSRSIPFGRQAATDVEATIFGQIKTALLAENPTFRIYHTPEKY